MSIDPEVVKALDEKIELQREQQPAPQPPPSAPPSDSWEFSLDRPRALRLGLASLALLGLVWGFGFLLGLLWNPTLPAVEAVKASPIKASPAQPAPALPEKSPAPAPEPPPPAEKQQPVEQQPPPQPEEGPYSFQVGAYSTSEGAQRMIGQLEKKGYQPYLYIVESNTLPRYRVRLGRFLTRAEASQAAEAFEASQKIEVLLKKNEP